MMAYLRIFLKIFIKDNIKRNLKKIKFIMSTDLLMIKSHRYLNHRAAWSGPAKTTTETSNLMSLRRDSAP